MSSQFICHTYMSANTIHLSVSHYLAQRWEETSLAGSQFYPLSQQASPLSQQDTHSLLLFPSPAANDFTTVAGHSLSLPPSSHKSYCLLAILGISKIPEAYSCSKSLLWKSFSVGTSGLPQLPSFPSSSPSLIVSLPFLLSLGWHRRLPQFQTKGVQRTEGGV